MNVLLAAALLVPSGAASAQTVNDMQVRIVVHADRPGPRIDPGIYGQFAEHLGRGIYEGIWVGEKSVIPNTHGYRNDVLDALRALHVPVVRWPGGCFADGYHWRDGIGARDGRPTTLNSTWGGVEENNAFGTHEFFDFAALVGARPYLNGNVGTGSPRETADWIEYITSDTQSALAQLRRKNGRDGAWDLPFFAVGNEAWGCGGAMRAEHYAEVYRQYAEFIRAPTGKRPVRVASGANANDFHWTETLLSQAAGSMDAISLHYYTLPTGRWEHKGPATGFDEEQWIGTFQSTLRMEELISRHAAIMDRYDRKKRIGLFVDEWGTWYDAEPGENAAFLRQPNTLRDALVAALNFQIFHAHADRVRMANIAQMVNVLQAMILTHDDRMLETPTYHVFEMYRPFQDATSVPADVDAPPYRVGDRAIRSVFATAARDAQGRLFLGLVNVDPHRGAVVTTRIVGASALAAAGRVLTGAAMDSQNTFAAPDLVDAAVLDGVRVEGGEVLVPLPSKSVAVIEAVP